MPTGPRPAPPVGTARVAFSGQFDTSPYASVFWLDLTATTHVIDDLKSIIDSMAAAWHTDMMPYQSSDVTLTDVKASWLYGVATELQYEGVYSYAGGDTTGPIKNVSTCAVLDWKIAAYYRGGHPRTYMPGVPATFIASSRELTDAYRALLATATSTWRNAVNALTHGGISAVALGTVSFQTAHAWRTPPVFRPYVDSAVRQVLGTQRRRLGGR